MALPALKNWQLDFRLRILLYSSSKRGNLQNHRSSRQGFTLVELSIVLVIIGLLIGGVLIGQSLIESARLVSFSQQITSYDIAVGNFKDRYKYWPGDSQLFSSPGDRNNVISAGNSSGGAGPIACGTEVGNFWKYLSDSAMIKEQYSAYDCSGFKTKQHAPSAKLTSINSILFAETTTNFAVSGNWGISEASEYWHICYPGGNSASTTSACTNGGSAGNHGPGPITPIQASSYDTKFDDGRPGTGNFQATYGMSSSRSRNASPYCFSTTGANHTAANYNMVVYPNIPGCDLFIKMLSSTVRR